MAEQKWEPDPAEATGRRPNRNWLIGLVAVTVLACCGGAVALNRLAYEEETAPPKADDSPSAAPTTGAPAPPQPAPPTDASSPTSAAAPIGAAPDVVGKRLNEAKILLSAAGFTTKILDATGQGRLVLEDQNWIVASQEPAVGAVVTLNVRKPTDGKGAPTVTAGVVPDVVCKDLQSAQEALRGARYFNVRSEDATGRGRMQLLDRDWVVVGQSEPPETSPALTTRIVLQVVKYGEPTGESGCQS